MKKSRFFLVVILICLPALRVFPQKPFRENIPRKNCLTETELELARQINAYRVSKGLRAVKLSVSLSTVALVHCKDLDKHYTHSGRCNLHSWSDDGPWTSCCYTPDHKKAACIWDKPRELTPYAGDGYEIAYYNSKPPDEPAAFARDILESWKGSPGHHNVIINRGIWDDVEWNAMGVGIWNGYATVWFGKEPDPEGVPDECN